MIRLRDVEKSYRAGFSKTFVLRQISLDIAEGEFVTIMGPSGAGKSTLLGILGMLDGDFAGEYFLDDHATRKMRPKDRMELNKRYIGFVFQSYHLLDDLTVYENLDVPLSYRNIPRKERAGIAAGTRAISAHCSTVPCFEWAIAWRVIATSFSLQALPSRPIVSSCTSRSRCSVSCETFRGSATSSSAGHAVSCRPIDSAPRPLEAPRCSG